MPGASGKELGDELTRLNPELPVLFVSGYCEDYRSAMHGFTCLAKPFTPAELIALPEKALTEKFKIKVVRLRPFV